MVAVISHNGWNKRQQRASHVRTPVAPFPRVASYLRISRNERSFPQDAFPFFYSLSLSFFPFLKLSLPLQSRLPRSNPPRLLAPMDDGSSESAVKKEVSRERRGSCTFRQDVSYFRGKYCLSLFLCVVLRSG